MGTWAHINGRARLPLRRLAGSVLLAAVIVGAGCSRVPPGPTTPIPALKITPVPRATAVVTRGPISQAIHFIGRVAAVRQADLSFKAPGQIAKVAVKPGDAVKAGQVLAELDGGDLPVQIAQARLNVQLAQLRVDQARAQAADAARQHALDVKQAELDVKQAEAQLARAQADLAKAKAAPDPVAAAENALAQAQLQLQLAQQNKIITDKSEEVAKNVRERQYEVNWYEVNYGKVKERFDKGEASQQELDMAWSNLLAAKEKLDTARAQAQIAELQAQQSVAQAQAAVDKARADLEAARSAPKDAEVHTAQMAVEAAQLGLERARAAYEQKTAAPSQDDVELKLLQNAVEQAKVALDELLAKQAATRLLAPFDGKILYVRIRAGDPVEANQAVIGIADPSALEVRADLADTDLPLVAVGQAVSLGVDVLPGQTLTGRIAAVPGGLTGRPAPGADQSVQIEVSWPAGAATRVQIGMLARGSILVRQKPDALLVPLRAIKTVGDRKFVEYMDGQIRRAQNVEVGIVSDEYAEVVSGLREGQVILAGP
ncbi:MAG: efflux RND transporter periplasmic adaptor subunit [Chloroflexi bacterium]|nr:efflux RND transporter periplasmic adaptor subunit [Chloroflexota bacterium]